MYDGWGTLGKKQLRKGKLVSCFTELLNWGMKEEKKLETVFSQLGSLEYYSQEMVHFRKVYDQKHL